MTCTPHHPSSFCQLFQKLCFFSIMSSVIEKHILHVFCFLLLPSNPFCTPTCDSCCMCGCPLTSAPGTSSKVSSSQAHHRKNKLTSVEILETKPRPLKKIPTLHNGQVTQPGHQDNLGMDILLWIPAESTGPGSPQPDFQRTFCGPQRPSRTSTQGVVAAGTCQG